VRRFSRIALALVAVYALARLADPEQRWAALVMGGDRVEHGIVVYLVTLLSLAAFPKVRLWTPALALIAVGVVVELIQALPGVVGGFQAGDIAADVGGAVAATFPAWLLRERTSRGA